MAHSRALLTRPLKPSLLFHLSAPEQPPGRLQNHNLSLPSSQLDRHLLRDTSGKKS